MNKRVGLGVLLVAWSARGDAEAAPDADADPLRAGLHRLVELSIEVEPTTAKGKPWDTSKDSIAEPDLIVKLRANGKKLGECEAGTDTVKGYCKLDLTIDLTAETRIELEVIDDDGAFDDAIGSAVLESPLAWEAGQVALTPKGRVKHALITLVPVPSWFAAHRPGLIGFGLGIAGALGLIGALRKRLLVPDPAPPPMPTCAHCNSTLRKRDRRCFHCGAPR